MNSKERDARNHWQDTDRRLRRERSKTDKLLNENQGEVDDNVDEAISASRRKIDGERAQSRQAVDARAHADADPAEKRLLGEERAQADEASIKERAADDRIRALERRQKKMLAESLLGPERDATNVSLSNERDAMDREVSDQRTLHSATRDALTTRDEFLAIVSHDLRNPLGAVAMSASLLREGLEGRLAAKDGALEYITVIERNVAMMDRMIGDLLDVERMAAGKFPLKVTETRFADVFDELRDLFTAVAGKKNIRLRIASETGELSAPFDPDRLVQALSNLIGNAVKFTPSGGQIDVSARRSDKNLVISVVDNGPGIAEDMQDSIFNRFSQLKSKDRRGLGLGLYIAKGIVEAHGGDIKIKSRPGHGADFSVSIPATTPY